MRPWVQMGIITWSKFLKSRRQNNKKNKDTGKGIKDSLWRTVSRSIQPIEGRESLFNQHLEAYLEENIEEQPKKLTAKKWMQQITSSVNMKLMNVFPIANLKVYPTGHVWKLISIMYDAANYEFQLLICTNINLNS